MGITFFAVRDSLENSGRVKVLPACKYRYIMHPGESLITRFCMDKPQVCLEADQVVQALCAALGSDEATDADQVVQNLCTALGSDEATDADCRYMFAKSIFSCMTTLFSPSCPLDGREKRRYVAAIVNQPRVRLRCRRVFGGFVPNLLCAVVRSGWAWLNLLVFRLLAVAGRLSPKLFTRLKHKK